MTENIITWNFTNWVTVVLMAFLAFLVFGLIAGFVTRGNSQNNQQGG